MIIIKSVPRTHYIPYFTEDGHEMKSGEVMWRVSNTQGKWFGEPGSVNYSSVTGYNMLDANAPAFPPEHIHFYSKKLAEEYLKNKIN